MTPIGGATTFPLNKRIRVRPLYGWMFTRFEVVRLFHLFTPHFSRPFDFGAKCDGGFFDPLLISFYIY